MEAIEIKYGDKVVVRRGSDSIPFIGSNTGDCGVQEIKFEDGYIGLGFFDNQMGIYIKLIDCEKIPEKFIDYDEADLLYLVRYGKTRKQIIE